MGGSSYDRSYAEETRRENREQRREAFRHTALMNERPVEERGCHSSLNAFGMIRECVASLANPAPDPVVIAMDVTRSRGEDARKTYEAVPGLIGQLKSGLCLPQPQVLFMAVGDAFVDKASIQVGQFESGNEMDDNLTNFFLEKGGGGTGEESYELAAFMGARRMKLHATERRKKGHWFFVGDEKPYDKVDKGQVQRLLGVELDRDIPTEKIFKELQEKFHVYLIMPAQTWEQRRSDIDEEIRQRVTEAGGRYENCDIRVSLIWNNRNDLDLHCTTPNGQHLFYASKVHQKGALDVDRNVHGETTKPVENIRWAAGDAPKGRYRFWVENFNFHERTHDESNPATPFKVEIEINGKVQHFQGQTPAGATHDRSRVDVIQFEYDPAERAVSADRYAAYHDDAIKAAWARLIPAENILTISDPASICTVVAGAIAVQEGNDFHTVLGHLGQGTDRKLIGDAEGALRNLANSQALAPRVNLGGLPGKRGPKGPGSSDRL